MTLSLIQIHSETNISLSKWFEWEREREKWGFISYLSAWGSDRHVCLKMGTHESISVAHGQR